MSDRISSVTKALLTLCLFFVCATLGAAMALFVGWPVAVLSGVVAFVLVQQVRTSFGRRSDKRVQAKEIAHLRKNYLDVETALHETRVRLGELSGHFEERAGAQEKKIVSELKVLESLVREFAGKISRGAVEVPHDMPQPSAARPAPMSGRSRPATATSCWKPSVPAWKKTASICICSPSSACRNASCAITKRCRGCATRTARSSCRPNICRWPRRPA